MTQDQTIIEFDNVSFSFGNTAIHHNISFKVNRGETITLIGPSGAGKTVILKLIIGLLDASSGSIKVFGKDLSRVHRDELLHIRRKVGMLFQGAALFDSLSVYENIAYPLREAGESNEDKITNIVAEKLAVVGLAGIEERYPPKLSGGQKKRVGLARALASSPEVVLFDEPTTGLDPTATRLIDELILKLKTDFGITSIAVTHDIASARRFSDRWILINKGLVAADGPVEEIAELNKDVLDFISGNWRAELRT